jgi:predicted metal-dependent hydrolase
VARHALRAGREAGRLSLRDTRSRWGSCSCRGDIMLSWRLVMAPPAILDYVAAHEAAHLVRMDHSRDFWRLVARLDPGHEAARGWLRREGASLHRWRFD